MQIQLYTDIPADIHRWTSIFGQNSASKARQNLSVEMSVFESIGQVLPALGRPYAMNKLKTTKVFSR